MWSSFIMLIYSDSYHLSWLFPSRESLDLSGGIPSSESYSFVGLLKRLKHRWGTSFNNQILTGKAWLTSPLKHSGASWKRQGCQWKNISRPVSLSCSPNWAFWPRLNLALSQLSFIEWVGNLTWSHWACLPRLNSILRKLRITYTPDWSLPFIQCQAVWVRMYLK